MTPVDHTKSRYFPDVVDSADERRMAKVFMAEGLTVEEVITGTLFLVSALKNLCDIFCLIEHVYCNTL